MGYFNLCIRGMSDSRDWAKRQALRSKNKYTDSML